ncbi:MAG: 16S rRNA (cytosine(967)-C(5))-methyltransferase RsmB [Ruminococcaceae bacterium]|nr:16S rRNA (cytosine(967)-C(5))-methyltransferase RsmB [Oscillospiraceae bacterium]
MRGIHERTTILNPRKAAVLSLNSCIKNGRFTNLEADSMIKKYKFEGLDRGFFTALLYGTTERLLTLDFIISKFSKIEFEKIDPVILCILRTAIYQILYMDRVPDSAACNEAVDICRTTSHGDNLCGYVNGVLRSVVRSKEKIPEMISKEGGRKAVSIATSIPLWIIDSLAEDYGEKTAFEFAGHISGIGQSVTLRVNTVKTTRESLLSALGNHAQATENSDFGIKLDGSFPVTDLYGFSEGLFYVQDEASQLCTSLINDVNEDTVTVDVCACPGGKTFSAAIQLGNKGRVYSFDLHKNRIKLIDSGAERLGLTNITTEARDARTGKEDLFGKADYVICDVPCSGLGVIAKKPDIRYKDKSDVENLPAVQYDILCESVKYLKKGATLIYSTCTLRRAENEDIVNKFLQNNPGYRLVSTGLFGKEDGGYVTLLPQKTGTDGFFIAKLVKE